MRHAGNFNPEWGYLAPAPTFLRTARGLIAAAIIGGAAGAAVVISLMDRPAGDASVAARTMIVAEPSAIRPFEAGSLVGGAQAAVQAPMPATPAATPSQHADVASASSPPSAQVPAHAVSVGVSEHAAAAVTSRHAPMTAALVDAPRIMAPETPIARTTTADAAAAPVAAEAATSPTAGARAPIGRRVVGRGLPRYGYAAPRYRARPYALLPQYGQY
jgi:hypothetical protein